MAKNFKVEEELMMPTVLQMLNPFHGVATTN
jgi:hypothetical protein